MILSCLLPLLQHFNCFHYSALACLFSFGLVNPHHIFSLMCVGKLIKEGFGFFFCFECLLQLCRDFNHTRLNVRLNYDFHIIAKSFADLFTDFLKDDQQVVITAHACQNPAIGDSFDHCLDFGPLRTERFLHIEGNFHIRAASARVLDSCCKGLFFRHGLYLSFKFLGTRFFPPTHVPTMVLRIESRKLVSIAVSKRPSISASSTGKPSVRALIRKGVGIRAPSIMPKTPPNTMPVK